MNPILKSATLVCLAVPLTVGSLVAQQDSGATVSKATVEDSFFNQCTGEAIDRSYTRHITRRRSGDDYVLAVNMSDGKGVGRETGDQYVITWTYHQLSQQAEHNAQGTFTYRIKTTVRSQGSASDYTSDILIRLRQNADGSVSVEEQEASGILCS